MKVAINLLILLSLVTVTNVAAKQPALSDMNPAKQLILEAQHSPYPANLKLYGKAIAVAPNSAEVYAERALAYEAAGKTDQAISDCDKSIALDPDLDNVYLVKARCLLKKEQFERALIEVEKFEKHDSGQRSYVRYQVPLIRGTISYRLGRFKQASEQLPHALFMDDGVKCADAYYYLALSQSALHDNQSALKNLDTAITTKRVPEYIAARAKVFAALGKTDLAERNEKRLKSKKTTR